LYGVIDIGSNTIRLSVYKKTNNSFKLVFNNKNMAALVSYVNKDGNLSEAGTKKIISVLTGYKQIIESVKVKEIFVIATASLRNTDNAKSVIDTVYNATGYRIDMISGVQEATYDYIGASHFMDLKDGILIDIGGGSTELVFYQNKEIEKALSMPIGSLNLYYKHIKDILPTSKELAKIKTTVRSELKKLDIEDPYEYPYQMICGVGGTIRALGKLNNHIYGQPMNNRVISVQNTKDLLERFSSDRSFMTDQIIQIAPDRIHSLIPGMMILLTIAKRYHIGSVMISKFGVKEGYLITKLFGE